MSNSYFLNHSDKGDCILDVIEWNYEIPPMFFPLFSAKPIYRSRYLYCDAGQGYQLFKDMYEFLEKHKDKAFDLPEEFLVYKDKIVKAVEPLGEHFYLNGETIFSMTLDIDKKGVVLEETKKVYFDMEKVNAQIKCALMEDDIEKFLDIFTEVGVASVSRSLREWFNDKNYLYGFAPLSASMSSEEAVSNEVEVYSEKNKVGLRYAGGDIITVPKYDIIYDFDDTGCFALVRLDDKYGYIDQKGFEFIPLVYDDAYDFWGSGAIFSPDGYVISKTYRAVVVRDGKSGVIDEKNNVIIPFVWDDIFFKRAEGTFIPDFISVEKNGKKGIFDLNGQEKYPVIIDDLLVGTQKEDGEEYPINGFSECLWVRMGNDWFYLNDQFQPYGRGMYIRRNGELVRNTDARDNEIINNTFLFTASNPEGQWGVISSHDDVLVPIQYECVETLVTPSSPRGLFIFQAKRNEVIDLYKIGGDLSVDIVFSDRCKKINYFSMSVIEVSTKKKGLYDIDKKMYVLDCEYDYFLYLNFGSKDGAIFALKDEDLYQYDTVTFERVELISWVLDQAIHAPLVYLPKSIKSKIDQFKKRLSNDVKNKIFDDPDDLNCVQQRLFDVDFSNPRNIYLNAEIIFKENQYSKDQFNPNVLQDMRFLYKAYAHHFGSWSFDVKFQEEKGLISYYLAYFIFYQTDVQSGDGAIFKFYSDDALILIPKYHLKYIEVARFGMYLSYFCNDFKLCIYSGIELLELIKERRSKAKEGGLWYKFYIKDMKGFLAQFDAEEEMCHYYLGNAYISSAMVDYALAKKHIELAMEFGSWKEYEKKYVQAVALVNLESPDVFLPVLESFMRYSSDLNKDSNWVYICYLYAFYEYRHNNHVEKARRLIDEGLAVDSEDENLLNLKKIINDET